MEHNYDIHTTENHTTGNTSGCEIDPFENDLSPLLFLPGSNEFTYPKHGDTVIKLYPEQPLHITCPGGTVVIANFTTNSSLLSGSCINGGVLKIGNKAANWKRIRCSTSPVSKIRYTGNSCDKDGKEIEIGFPIGLGGFLRSILICFDQEWQIARYSFVKIPASINQRINKTPRPTFNQGQGIYNITSVNDLYLRKNQRATVNSLVGLPDNSTQYIQDRSDYFLSRGHLTANMDNFYAAQQNATFYYQNAAPQWQTLNGKDWNQIEIDVRDYASNNGVELHVWTGTWQVTTLRHVVTNAQTDIYLYVDESTNGTALPVPAVFWKVVLEPSTKKGVALLGVNNPYVSLTNKLCPDVSQNLTWLHIPQEGPCYACTIDHFKMKVFNISTVVDNGLLL